MKKSSTTIILTKTNTIKRIYFIMVFVSAYPYVRQQYPYVFCLVIIWEIVERDLFTSPIFFGDFVSIERAS